MTEKQANWEINTEDKLFHIYERKNKLNKKQKPTEDAWHRDRGYF